LTLIDARTGILKRYVPTRLRLWGTGLPPLHRHQTLPTDVGRLARVANQRTEPKTPYGTCDLVLLALAQIIIKRQAQ